MGTSAKAGTAVLTCQPGHQHPKVCSCSLTLSTDVQKASDVISFTFCTPLHHMPPLLFLTRHQIHFCVAFCWTPHLLKFMKEASPAERLC